MILQTPTERFQNLEGYPFKPNYVSVAEGVKMHFVDEGNPSGEVVLLMHGEPTWSYLYRKMIPGLVEAGFRVIAPDLIGFGKSDKFSDLEDYSYQNHIDWVKNFLQAIDLQNITLFCQDWGGLLGLRIVAENPALFVRVVASNTGLPTGDQPSSDAFKQWQEYSQSVPVLPVGNIVNGGCVNKLSAEEIAAYDAPFPDESYKAGPKIFPKLVPTTPADPANQANRKAWEVLMKFKKPLLTCFSDSDPITKGGDMVLQQLIPGAANQNHTTIIGAGHFLQEEKSKELVKIIIDFIKNNPL
jgi:haloalkane dehalogenase